MCGKDTMKTCKQSQTVSDGNVHTGNLWNSTATQPILAQATSNYRPGSFCKSCAFNHFIKDLKWDSLSKYIILLEMKLLTWTVMFFNSDEMVSRKLEYLIHSYSREWVMSTLSYDYITALQMALALIVQVSQFNFHSSNLTKYYLQFASASNKYRE